MVAMQIKRYGAFLSVADTHVCVDICVQANARYWNTVEPHSLRARARSGVQEERHYISIRHSRIRYRLICHGNDSVFLRDTCNVCTACALLGCRFEIEAIRPSLGTAPWFIPFLPSLKGPHNSFRHIPMLNWFIHLYEIDGSMSYNSPR